MPGTGPADLVTRYCAGTGSPDIGSTSLQERGTIGAVACARYLPLLPFCSKTFGQTEPSPRTGNNAVTRAKLRSTLGGVSREKGSAISSKIDAIAEQARTMERRGGGGKIGNKDFHFCFFASPPSYRAVLEARGFDRMRFLESLRVFGESLPFHVSANLPLCFPSFPFVSFSFLRPRILLFFSSLFLLLSFLFLSLSFSFPSFRFKIFIF